MTELSALFEVATPLRRYADVEAELQAIIADEKAMSVFSFTRDATADSEDDEQPAITRIALALGLSVTQHLEKIEIAGSIYEQQYIFALKPEQSWRVSSYIATRRILREYNWSDGAEYLESYLLGYDDSNIRSWMDRINKTRASWTGKTIHLLVSKIQKKKMAELGMRSLDPCLIGDGILVFFPRFVGVIRSDAASLIPDEMVVARVAVKEPFFRRLFGTARKWGSANVVRATITGELATIFNSALESNFQFWNNGEWR
jgi:hypothetical protein